MLSEGLNDRLNKVLRRLVDAVDDQPGMQQHGLQFRARNSLMHHRFGRTAAVGQRGCGKGAGRLLHAAKVNGRTLNRRKDRRRDKGIADGYLPPNGKIAR